MRTTRKEEGGKREGRERWGRHSLGPDRIPEAFESGMGRQKAVETIKGMLAECEDCMAGGLLDEASDLSKAALLMAQRHGFEGLKEDAAIRLVILDIEMGRPERIERAIADGWVEGEAVEYISGLFAEAGKPGPLPSEEPGGSRPRTISELKEEILGLIGQIKADIIRGNDSPLPEE